MLKSSSSLPSACVLHSLCPNSIMSKLYSTLPSPVDLSLTNAPMHVGSASLPLLNCIYVLSTAVPTAPSPPRMLTVTGTPTGSTVELNWLPPLHPNGAIHYDIEYEPAMTVGNPNTVEKNVVTVQSSSSFYYNLRLPSEFVTYNVKVVAVNTQDMRLARSNVVKVCPGMNRQGVWCIHIYCMYMTLVLTCMHIHIRTYVHSLGCD